MKSSIYLILVPYILIAVGCALPSRKLSTPTAILTYHQFSELDSLMADERRPVAVFLHARWCRFCKNMEQTTFRDSEVMHLLNKKFYFISFDGEQKKDILFNGSIFRFQPNGRNQGVHSLASAIGTIDGELTYPTFVILNSHYETMFQYNAFLDKNETKNILEKYSEKELW